ncbi:hypothetical protein B296_00019413, partial [Ensete ventricosum]
PRSPAERRGGASSSHGKTRPHLVLTLEDEATPRLPCAETRRCLVVSFSRGEMLISIVLLGSGRSTYQYLIVSVCTARIGRYKSKRRTLLLVCSDER